MTRYFIWTEDHSARFLKVFDGSAEMKFMRANQGQVVVDEDAQEMSALEITENIEQALQHGFREVLEAEFSEEYSRLMAEFQKHTIEPKIPGANIIAWKDLRSEFKQYLSNEPEEYLPSNLRSFCVYDAPCQLVGDLKIGFDSDGPTVQTAKRNIIFKQGLAIDGNFDAGGSTTELPQLVIVLGDLHAKNMVLTGWVEVVVTGDVKIEGILFGYDGEAGGSLKVHGSLSAKQVLGGMMYNISVAGRTEADVYWTDEDEATLLNARKISGSLSHEQAAEFEKHTPLAKEAYFFDSNWATGKETLTLVFTPSQVVDLIRDGKHVFSNSIN